MTEKVKESRGKGEAWDAKLAVRFRNIFLVRKAIK